MKLVRYTSCDSGAQIGLIFGEKVVPLSALLHCAPSDMIDVIQEWEEIKDQLADAENSKEWVPLDSVELLAPVPDPEKILAIGMNYADHIKEAEAQGVQIPQNQVWFTKLKNALNAPFGEVEKPLSSEKLDYEVELVAIIGKGGKNIAAADAPAAVFGYAVGQDFTARDWQFRNAQWVLGKSFDTHAPIGPGIVTADQIGDPHRLDIKCWVNGELRQSSNTKHLYFNLWDQIADLSKAITLKPGDIIFTGTPGGVGVAMTPPVFLVPGDVVRTEIEELGVIENRIIAES